VISEKGVVKANVKTVDAVIQGTYEGTMVATGEVEIASTGRVNGHIETDALVIAKGGTFIGNVTKPGGGKSKPVYLLDDKRTSLPAIPAEAAASRSRASRWAQRGLARGTRNTRVRRTLMLSTSPRLGRAIDSRTP